MDNLRIIFFGTPDFAVASLDILHKNHFEIVGVVTSPDKPAGRRLKTHESAIKKYAIENHLSVLQPEKLKDPEFIKQLQALKADIQVVVAFRMLPEIVWNMPSLGTINLHASLLPQYRGAAPINWAIINGEKKTGVTTFKLQQEIDTGKIIDQKTIPIKEDETAGQLHDLLMQEGARLLLKTIQSIADGSFQLISQHSISDNELPVKMAPKIFKEDCRINWNKDVDQIYNLIRGLSPYPAAWTTLNGKQLKILMGKKDHTPPLSSPGIVETDHKTFFKVACKDGWLYITDMQMEGKKRLGTEEFLKGYREKYIRIE